MYPVVFIYCDVVTYYDTVVNKNTSLVHKTKIFSKLIHHKPSQSQKLPLKNKNTFFGLCSLYQHIFSLSRAQKAPIFPKNVISTPIFQFLALSRFKKQISKIQKNGHFSVTLPPIFKNAFS